MRGLGKFNQLRLDSYIPVCIVLEDKGGRNVLFNYSPNRIQVRSPGTYRSRCGPEVVFVGRQSLVGDIKDAIDQIDLESREACCQSQGVSVISPSR